MWLKIEWKSKTIIENRIFWVEFDREQQNHLIKRIKKSNIPKLNVEKHGKALKLIIDK